MNTKIVWVFGTARRVCVDAPGRATPDTFAVRAGAVRATASLATLLAALLGTSATPTAAQVLPAGGKVVRGSGSVDSTAAGLRVNQTSSRMVVDWQSFSIGPGATVRFEQPTADAVALNRVTGSSASTIFGSLLSNGHVYLQNPSGVLFGAGAQVSVGSLVATTLNADPAQFMAGRLRLSGGGGVSGAEVRNEGRIETASGGYALLAGLIVSNAGSIVTPNGTTALAAAAAVTVDPTGAGLLSISVPVAALNVRLTNTGSLQADGGVVELRAAAIEAAQRSVMQVDGLVRARSIERRGGRIVLDAGTSGSVQVGGALDAAGAAAGTHGGMIEVLGERVALVDAARLDASGAAGGGSVLVGGAYQGRGPQPNATDTSVGSTVRIEAGATERGDGGSIVVWSDRLTTFAGSATATGGRSAGDGGRIEVSGKQLLRFEGGTDLRAPRGKPGTLLLDPSNIVIGDIADANGDGKPGDDVTAGGIGGSSPLGVPSTSYITAGQVGSLLATGNLTLMADVNIKVARPVTVAAAGGNTTLALQAGATIDINAALSLNHSSLRATTVSANADRVTVNAAVDSLGSVAVFSRAVDLRAPLAAASVELDTRSASESIGAGGLTGSVVTPSLTLTNSRGEEHGPSVTLTGPGNRIGLLDLNVGVASIRVDNPSGSLLDVRGSATSLRLGTESGISQSSAPGGSLRVAGSLMLLPFGSTSSAQGVRLANAGNVFGGDVSFASAGSVSLRSSALRASGVAAGAVELVSSAAPFVLIGDITSTASTIDITGQGFVDNDSSAARHLLTVPASGRFIVRSGDYRADNLGSLAFSANGSRDFNFKVFAGNTAALPAAGNGFFTNQVAQLLTPSGDLPPITKVYDASPVFHFAQTGSTALAQLLPSGAGERLGAYTVHGDGVFASAAAGSGKGYATAPSNEVVAMSPSGAAYFGLSYSSIARPGGTLPVGSPGAVSEVTPAPLVIGGVRALDKTYDATTVATLAGTPAVTPFDGDSLVLGGQGIATFADKNVGAGKAVSVGGYALIGSDAGNYRVVQPTGLSAAIVPAALAITGIRAADRPYDATTAVAPTGTPLVLALGRDDVAVVGTGSGRVADKNAAVGKPVTVSGYALTGVDAPNYLAVQPSGLTVTVAPLAVTPVGITAVGRVQDGTTIVMLNTARTSLGGVLPGDAVALSAGGATGQVDTPEPGIAKPVLVTGLSLTGSDAVNYALTAPVRTTVTIISTAQDRFDRVRNREYLQAVSDAQQPLRRPAEEALARGYANSAIRRQLQDGFVAEVGPAGAPLGTPRAFRRAGACTASRSAGSFTLACEQ